MRQLRIYVRHPGCKYFSERGMIDKADSESVEEALNRTSPSLLNSEGGIVLCQWVDEVSSGNILVFRIETRATPVEIG